jgi:ethanolamine ammonia-lyase small subunit
MGAYLTWQPRAGRTDADRNCLSNIRDGGLNVETAAERLMWLMQTARAMKLTGVGLKEGAVNSLLDG